ncbi:MAG: DUF4089 domain-containing protein [Rhodospirillales bacterium]|nr:DUF4089 domain-containing protein [Rhodospirillales bacterium]
MSDTPDEAQLDALIAATAPVLGLAIDPAWQGGIRQHLAISLTQMRLVDEFALPDDAEPAPVFRA